MAAAAAKDIGQVDLVAAQHVPPALANYPTPNLPHLIDGSTVHLLGGKDSGGVEAGLHPLVDAGEVEQVEGEEFPGDIGIVEDDEAVGFFTLGGDLRQKRDEAQADRAVKAFADLAMDRVLDQLCLLYG